NPKSATPKIQVTEAIVNDLTIQAATVNGSGSQTANLVLTRAIFHMGIPVAPKNVFPSNIEGLPTWYQLRITPEGHMARSDKVDILVAYNVATWREDLKTVRPGGVVIHEEAFSTLDVRGDVTYYAVPFAKLAKSKIQSDTLRKQLANMIYVGVVAGVLNVPWEALEHGVRRQFLAKPKAVQVNLDAIKVGYDHWQDSFSKQDPYRLEPMTAVDRAADAHVAGRYRFCLHVVSRRHQAHRVAAGDSRGVLRALSRRLRLRRPLSDSGVRALRSRPGHEPLDDAGVQVSGQELRP